MDSQLVKHVYQIDAWSGTGPTHIEGTASGEDTGEVTVQFRVLEENRWEMLGVPKASNKENLEKFTKHFQSNDFRFTLRYRQANERIAKLSMIRSAYLIAFQYLGYGFLISANLQTLRHQFQNPEREIFPTQSVMFPVDIDDRFIGVNVISAPAEMRSYIIVFDVRAKAASARRVGVMLPGPYPQHIDMFQKLDDLVGTTMTIDHLDVDFESKLAQPRLALEIWEQLAGGSPIN
jgi:hypothetical protein